MSIVNTLSSKAFVFSPINSTHPFFSFFFSPHVQIVFFFFLQRYVYLQTQLRSAPQTWCFLCGEMRGVAKCVAAPPSFPSLTPSLPTLPPPARHAGCGWRTVVRVAAQHERESQRRRQAHPYAHTQPSRAFPRSPARAGPVRCVSPLPFLPPFPNRCCGWGERTPHPQQQGDAYKFACPRACEYENARVYVTCGARSGTAV